jgi:hydroxyacylglutathione hydrolase
MVGDEKTKECAVIDPTRDVDDYLRIAKAEGLRITHVLETHVHADYVSGSAELKERTGQATRVYSSGMGGKEWTPPYADHVVKNGDEIRLGSVRLQAIHTPGHTPEHISWAVYDQARSKDAPWFVMTGDFLFVGDVGRPDLLGEEARKTLAHQLYQSVFEVLPVLPDFTEIFPGHGAGSLCGKALGSRNSSTLGFERRFSEPLQKRPEAEWIHQLLKGMPIAPPYFRRMKQVNAAGPRRIGLELPGQRRIAAREIRDRVCDRCLVLDVRPKEAFASAHIPGSINIPLGANLPSWAGWVLPYDTPMILVLESPANLHEVVTHLIRIGLDEVQGYLEGGIEAWESAGYPLSRINTASVFELAETLKNRNGVTVLDVRTEAEWLAGHIDGAVHIHGGQLQERVHEVPRDKPVAVICGTGYRGSIASSFLKREGYEQVTNILGGMSAWRAAGLPMMTA